MSRASEVALALMCKMCVKEVWRRNKRMGSGGSLWLLGGNCVPAAAGWQITHQVIQLCPTSGGTAAASLLYSWQRCRPAHGRGTWDRRRLSGLLSPTVTQQVCTYTKRLQGLLSRFGKISIDLKPRALPE